MGDESVPEPVGEPQVQARVQRHFMEDMGYVCLFVQILDLPVPQMVDTVLEFFRLLDLPVAEQVIEVPSPRHRPLVEVPTVLSCALLQQRNAEQIIDIPRLGGSRSFSRCCPGPGSLQRSVEQYVDIPIPRRGDREGLQCFSPGRGSGQRIVEQNVDIPRPHRARRTVEQNVDIPVPRTRTLGGLQGFSPDRDLHSVLWRRTSTFQFLALVPVVVFPQNRVCNAQ